MKFNLYLIQGTIPFLSEIISNVKFYPTKTNFKTPKIHTFVLSVWWYTFKKLSQYKQLILKINTALKTVPVTPYHCIQYFCLPFWKFKNSFQKWKTWTSPILGILPSSHSLLTQSIGVTADIKGLPRTCDKTQVLKPCSDTDTANLQAIGQGQRRKQETV